MKALGTQDILIPYPSPSSLNLEKNSLDKVIHPPLEPPSKFHDFSVSLILKMFAAFSTMQPELMAAAQLAGSSAESTAREGQREWREHLNSSLGYS